MGQLRPVVPPRKVAQRVVSLRINPWAREVTEPRAFHIRGRTAKRWRLCGFAERYPCSLSYLCEGRFVAVHPLKAGSALFRIQPAEAEVCSDKKGTVAPADRQDPAAVRPVANAPVPQGPPRRTSLSNVVGTVSQGVGRWRCAGVSLCPLRHLLPPQTCWPSHQHDSGCRTLPPILAGIIVQIASQATAGGCPGRPWEKNLCPLPPYSSVLGGQKRRYPACRYRSKGCVSHGVRRACRLQGGPGPMHFASRYKAAGGSCFRSRANALSRSNGFIFER